MKKLKSCLLSIILFAMFLFPSLSSAQNVDSKKIELGNSEHQEAGPRQDIFDPYQEDSGNLFLDEDGDHWNVEIVGALISSYWMTAIDVAISGNYAYVTTGMTGLKILDVSDPLNPFEIGNCDTEGDYYVIEIAGDYAYIGNYDVGLQIVDISNPNNPFEVSLHSINGEPNNVAVSGDYAYVTTGGSPGMEIIDISDPVNPVTVSNYNPISDAFSISVSEGYAYVVSSGIMHIIDVNTPENPVGVGSFGSEENSVKDILIEDNIAFAIVENSLQVLNISDPENLSILGTCDINENIYCLSISGNYAYTGSNSALHTVNISDHTDPILSSTLNTDANIANVSSSNNFVFVTSWDASLHVIDASNPESPEAVAVYDSPNANPRYVTIDGNYAYVLYEQLNGEDDMGVIDISDPSSPASVGLYIADFVTECIAIKDDYAYLGGDYELKIINLEDPINPTEALSFPIDGMVYDIEIIGDYAYMCTAGDFIIFDVSEPTNPVIIGNMGFGRFKSVSISGNKAYLINHGGGSLYIVDISDNSNPVEISHLDLSSNRAYDSAVNGDYLYVIPNGNIIIVDISDPTSPEEVGFFDTAGAEIIVDGDYAYIASGESGLKVYDIVNPDSPIEVGYFDTHGRATGVAIFEEYVCVADGNLSIFDCSEALGADYPSPFSLISPIDNLMINSEIVELSWSESSDDVYEYVVWYSTSDDFAEEVDSLVTNSAFHNLSDLEDQTTYWWKVRANNETSSGRWSSDTWSFFVNSSLDIDDDLTSIPTEFAITDTYPNPFNPTLNVSISMPESSDLKVSVYNIMGQSVATLADRSYTAGIHSFTFDGSDLSSGVYFVHASIPGKLNQVKKVVLMK